AFRDSLLRQFHSALAETVHRVVVRFPRDYRTRKVSDGCPKFLMGERKVLRLHGGLAPRQGLFASRHGSLPPLHLPLRSGIYSLGKAQGTKHRRADGEECEEKR